MRGRGEGEGRATPPARRLRRLTVGAGFALAMTAPFELLYAEEVGVDAVGMGLFIAATFAGMLAVDVFGTRAVPYIDARGALAVGIATFGVSCVLLGLARGLPLLLVARVVQGLGSGLLMGAGLQASLRVSHTDHEAVGSFNRTFLFGAALGAPVGGLIAGLVPGGYRSTFGACAAVCLAMTILTWQTLPRLAPGRPVQARLSWPSFAGPPGTKLAIVLGMTGDFLRGGVIYTALPLVGDARGLSATTIGVAVGLLSAVEIGVLSRSEAIVARLGILPSLLAALAVGVLCALVLALHGAAWSFVVVSMLFGLAVAGATIGPPLVLVALAGDAAAGLATFRMASSTGMLVGSVGVGMLAAAFDPRTVFVAVALSLVGGAVLVVAVGRHLPTTGPLAAAR